ncbi:MAG: VWA domain-containing protein [Candidatus Acidiferrales bacterium]
MFSGVAPAQQPAPAGPPARPPAGRSDIPAAVLRITTRLVLVDVVVTDKDNRPVTGLTRDDFVLLEDGAPQTISTFSFESPASRAAGRPAPPPLPENVYTNRPEYRMPPGPLTILLLDALNTPATDQSFARQKMLEYLETQLLPNQRTAILGLTTSILILQDFTTDPALLKAAVRKHLPQTSAALAREEGGVEIPEFIASALPEEALQNIERFETESSAVALDSRVKTTLAALRIIARAVAGYPGRKNLIWVSAAFPFTFIPEDSENYDLLRFYADDIRRTAGSLTDAQVAVYPVDARGLVGPSALSSPPPPSPAASKAAWPSAATPASPWTTASGPCSTPSTP